MPGLTFRSISISILAMLVMAVVIQFSGVVDPWYRVAGAEGLPVPAFAIFLMLLSVVIGVGAAARYSLLTRAELFCILFILTISAPLMGQGFWRAMLGTEATIVRDYDYEKMDALSPALALRGPNLIQDSFKKLPPTEGRVTTREGNLLPRRQGTILTLENTGPNDVSSIRLSFPVEYGNKSSVVEPGSPYLLGLLLKADKLDSQTRYRVRVLGEKGEGNDGREVILSRTLGKKTYLQQEGFLRVGKYGWKFLVPENGKSLTLEIALVGVGKLDVADPWMIDVSALEQAYGGRLMISQKDYDKLPLDRRQGLIVQPESYFSLEGLKFLFTGFFPLKEWSRVVFGYSSYMFLIFLGTFSMMVLMRRQWLQSERYPLPMAQVPLAILGEDNEFGRKVSAIFKHPAMWTGFAICFFWLLLRSFKGYNSSLPDVTVSIPLKAYITDASWGNTWNSVTFTLYGLGIGIGLFMELNLALSLVVGFLLFRLQFLFGEMTGYAANQDFPWAPAQSTAAVLAYALMVLIFSRRYLVTIFKKVVKGGREEGDVLSYRTAFSLLVLSFIGVMAWSCWTGFSIPGMLVFFLVLLAFGFVAAKLRAECGTPEGAFLLGGIAVIIPFIGGMRFFGPDGLVFVSLSTVVFGAVSFWMIPGLQLECLELGRRLNVNRWHVIATPVVAILGVLLIGGWVYLSGLYSIGADNYRITGEFTSQGGNLRIYNQELINSTITLDPAGVPLKKGMSESQVAAIFGAGVTVLLTILRQLFAGFWFHPAGFIMGFSGMATDMWGSLLVACGLRFLVLRIGGAATVRNQLMPFATGIVLAVFAVNIIIFLFNAQLFFISPGGARPLPVF